MSGKKFWVSAVLLIALVVAGVGLASAQGMNSPQRLPQVRQARGFPIVRDMLKAIADKLGMNVRDLEKEVRSGKSILVIADEKSVSKDDLVKAAVDSQDERLRRAVDDGRITAEQKAWLEQKIGERVGNFLDRQGVGRLASPAFTREEWDAIADKLEMEPKELGKELQARTLAAIAAEKGVSLDDLTKAVADARKSALDDEVKGGHITQAQANAALSDFQEHLNKCVEEGQGLSCRWGARKLLGRLEGVRKVERRMKLRRNMGIGNGMQGQRFVPAPGWQPATPPRWGFGFGWPMPGAPGFRPMPRSWGHHWSNVPAPRR